MTAANPWPLATYFDASTLRQLPLDLASPDLVRLRETAQKYAIGMFVPAIAREEWIVAHVEAAAREQDRLASSARTLGKYLDRDPLGFEEFNSQELTNRVRDSQGSRFRAAGFTEIQTPAVDVDKLVAMAIRRVKPFKEGDKGFRDTLIAMTIAEHAKQFAGHSILVVSADNVFSDPEVVQQWQRVGVQALVAKTLEEAVEKLESAMDEAWKIYLNAEETHIKEFLVTRQAEIFARLKDVEVSEGFISGNAFAQPAYIGNLQRIRQVRPVEIARVSRGHVTGPFVKEGNRVPITFHVKIAFEVTVQTFSFADLMSGGPRFRLGEAVDLAVQQQMLSVPAPTEQEMTVEREITIEAWVVEGKNGVYEDLIIEKVLAW